VISPYFNLFLKLIGEINGRGCYNTREILEALDVEETHLK
jgi:hypothetical protein